MFKVLAEQLPSDDSKWKIFELVFMIAFLSKDSQRDLDFYLKNP